MKKFKPTWKLATIVLGVLLVIVSISKCGGGNSDKKYSEADVQEIVNQVVAQARAEAQAQAQNEAPQIEDSMEVMAEGSNTTQSNATQSSSSLPAELQKAAYEKGYDYGMSHHSMDLSSFTKNNEQNLKDEYIFQCRSGYHKLGDNYFNNRELYDIYRRGFMKGYEDGNKAL